MRTSPLKDSLAAAGASFGARYGVEIATSCSDTATEYHRIRDAAGLSDFSFMRKYRVPEEKGIDFLDAALAGNVARTRFGRLLHTFLADEQGHIVADCYVANNDEEFILLCESIVEDADIDALLNAHGAADAGLENLTDSHALISVDGYKAWQVAKELFGADVLGLPYLSVEVYPFEGNDVTLFRAGKTSEFGYLLMTPAAQAPALFARLAQEVERQGGGPCGLSVHDDLRLEGRFFNIHAEGLRVRDPLILGLQWMIDFDKESFSGAEPIFERRREGLKEKIIGVSAAPGVAVAVDADICDEQGPVARIVASCFSHTLERQVALAVFPVELAYAGLTFALGAADGPPVHTISMPPIMPKSLTVKLDEM